MPATQYQGRCHYCGKPVNGPYVAFGIVGWEVKREAGGANQIVMRQRVPEKVAHSSCVRLAADRVKRGVSIDQEVLEFG